MDPWRDINTAGYPFGGALIGQSWSNLCRLSSLFSEHPELKSCLEIGMWSGGMASFLGLHFPGKTVTADLRDARLPHTLNLHEWLGVTYRQVDCHDPARLSVLVQELERPAFVFCDGGCKRTEFLLVVPMLAAGDIVGVHDVGTEFRLDDPDIARCTVGLREIGGGPGVDETHAAYWVVP